MEKFIDCRQGQNPDIIAITQEGLKQLVDNDKLEILVKDEDTAFALENLGRAMDKQVTRKTLGQDFSISFFTQNTSFFPNLETNSNNLDLNQELVITISRTSLGPEKFGEKLMLELLSNLKKLETPPKAIIFYNQGVELLKTTAPTYKHIEYLKDLGIQICACALSLEHYKITQPKDKILFTKLNMLEIIAYLAGKYKILSF